MSTVIEMKVSKERFDRALTEAAAKLESVADVLKEIAAETPEPTLREVMAAHSTLDKMVQLIARDFSFSAVSPTEAAHGLQLVLNDLMKARNA